ncbi:uncharacterized protein [Rutidosis leptorrhynchoides]|uniref:uncharacterized protein n=1 Tax=Rutidosis leptorrhynchoides TaxID=125765 RepID=UPI003A996536
MSSSSTYVSSGNPCLDYFFHIVVPDTKVRTLIQFLSKSWEHDHLTTLKILLCNLRHGRLRVKPKYSAALWLQLYHPKTLACNVASMPDQFGYAKHLPKILYKLPDIFRRRSAGVRRKRRRSKRPLRLLPPILEDDSGGVPLPIMEEDGAALLPHEIISCLEDGGDDRAELHWKRMVDDMAKKGKLNNCLAICDVSDTMFGEPMNVCMALGLLVSELSKEPWKGIVITFSKNPKLHMVEGDDLKSKTGFIKRMDWGWGGGKINFRKVFDLILDVATKADLHNEDMVKRVFVFTDMEFDHALIFVSTQLSVSLLKASPMFLNNCFSSYDITITVSATVSNMRPKTTRVTSDEDEDLWGAISAPPPKVASKSRNVQPRAASIDNDDPWAAIAAPPPTTRAKPLAAGRGRGFKPAAPKLGAQRINRTSSSGV